MWHVIVIGLQHKIGSGLISGERDNIIQNKFSLSLFVEFIWRRHTHVLLDWNAGIWKILNVRYRFHCARSLSYICLLFTFHLVSYPMFHVLYAYTVNQFKESNISNSSALHFYKYIPTNVLYTYSKNSSKISKRMTKSIHFSKTFLRNSLLVHIYAVLLFRHVNTELQSFTKKIILLPRQNLRNS